jgi:hypothetical protein
MTELLVNGPLLAVWMLVLFGYVARELWRGPVRA